jgi:micrococcal nuclease
MGDRTSSLTTPTLDDLRVAEKTHDFSFNGRKFTAKVVQVYDGDTIRVKIIVDGEIQQYRVRMYGYDSPEMKPRLNVPDRAIQIKAAHVAKAALEQLIQQKDQLIQLHCGVFDKYGRILGNVFVGDLDINEWMITNGHGIPYFGGTKVDYHNNEIDVPKTDRSQ